MTDEEKLLADLMARLQELETGISIEHRKNGYQLNQEDIASLDELIQRALHAGSPDALAQFTAIRTAHQIHGKVSYEQMKLLKEVSDAFEPYRL